MSGTQYTEAQVTEALMAVITWAGNITAACAAMRSEKKLNIPPATVTKWVRDVHAARYNELREKYSAQLEAALAHEYRDVARQAVEVQRLALDKAAIKLRSDSDTDPGRTAANAARVAQSMTDKLLSLTGRPTQITETRNLQEILRSLAAKKVISLPASEIEEEHADATPANPE